MLAYTNKLLKVTEVGFKLIFFGIFYFWLFKMLAFYFYPKDITDGGTACGMGWLTIIYPLLTLLVGLVYILIIHTYSTITKKNVSLLYKLILYPLGIITILFIGCLLF